MAPMTSYRAIRAGGGHERRDVCGWRQGNLRDRENTCLQTHDSESYS
jgi:hypothetical protein